MAEINIQKKKKDVWPWILGIIVLALLVIGVIYWYSNQPNDNNLMNGQNDQIEQPTNNLQDER